MGVVVTDAEVTLADILSLRLAITEPLADGARLVLRQRGTGEERRVALGASGGRTRDAGVAVSLAPLDLAPGRWDAYLEQDGVRSRIQSVDPGFSLDRLDAYALGRRTLAYRAYRTRNGFLALKIDPAEPVADVRAVWFREGRFEVTGLLAYTGLDDDDQHRHATLALRYSAPIPGAADHKNSGHKDPGPVNRGHGGHGHGDQGHGDQGHGDSAATMRVAATVQGVRFHAALSLCDVLDATPDSQGSWEAFLEVDGVDRALPLGARLDDVEGKRRRVHYPRTLVDGVPIRPNFSPADELLLEVGA
ncbi:hypothetical protein GCM10010116_59750 [Microbispora rosea subsp. aerata]|nr:hypothetical protein [Microbispora rosea]GGO29767.1 hypothetical protein GCM10010116_59750 [Microbispora rosea subsp. aerata]GIH58958.1 hypothetical protein Mro02_58720 [Microbispora rosea subsp. aerata]GLJ86174.1 hypothetical protein GCM10017588_49080 [Microbispora rosea subsp. aerata]